MAGKRVYPGVSSPGLRGSQRAEVQKEGDEQSLARAMLAPQNLDQRGPGRSLLPLLFSEKSYLNPNQSATYNHPQAEAMLWLPKGTQATILQSEQVHPFYFNSCALILMCWEKNTTGKANP